MSQKNKIINAIAFNKAMTKGQRSPILNIIASAPSPVGRQYTQDELGVKLPSPVSADIRFLVEAKMIECVNYGSHTPLYKATERGRRYLQAIVDM